MIMLCPLCTAGLPDDDLFCEACGVPLSPAAEPPAMCDGVSASRSSELASSAAATVVSELLAGALQNGALADPERSMREAIDAAEGSLAAYPERNADDTPPSTTTVAALVADGAVPAGWAGDSRAYWIDSNGARQLTSDHSWMNSVVASGEMTTEEAERHPQAHANTRWLGADAGENAAADVVYLWLAPPGIGLLCTDGLWNYASTADALAKLVEESNRNGADALTVARNLVAFANSQGGHDNIITIALQLDGDSYGQRLQSRSFSE